MVKKSSLSLSKSNSSKLKRRLSRELVEKDIINEIKKSRKEQKPNKTTKKSNEKNINKNENKRIKYSRKKIKEKEKEEEEEEEEIDIEGLDDDNDLILINNSNDTVTLSNSSNSNSKNDINDNKIYIISDSDNDNNIQSNSSFESYTTDSENEEKSNIINNKNRKAKTKAKTKVDSNLNIDINSNKKKSVKKKSVKSKKSKNKKEEINDEEIDIEIDITDDEIFETHINKNTNKETQNKNKNYVDSDFSNDINDLPEEKITDNENDGSSDELVLRNGKRRKRKITTNTISKKRKSNKQKIQEIKENQVMDHSNDEKVTKPKKNTSKIRTKKEKKIKNSSLSEDDDISIILDEEKSNLINVELNKKNNTNYNNDSNGDIVENTNINDNETKNINNNKNKNKNRSKNKNKNKNSNKNKNKSDKNNSSRDDNEFDNDKKSKEQEENNNESDNENHNANDKENESKFIEDGFEEIDFEEIEFEENFKWVDKKEKIKKSSLSNDSKDNSIEKGFLDEDISNETLPKTEISTVNDENDFTEESQFDNNKENNSESLILLKNDESSVKDIDSNIDESNLNIEVEIKKDNDKEENNDSNKSKTVDEFSLMKSFAIEDNLSEESEEDDDDNEEWEQIEISKPNTQNTNNKIMPKLSSSDDLLLSNQSITITFDKDEIKKKKSKGINKFDRIVRELTHKVNLLCLLGSCRVWNIWSNNYEIKCISLSLLPNDILKIVKNSSNLKLDDFYSSIKQFCEWFRNYTGLDINDNEESEISIMSNSTSKSSIKSKSKSSRSRKKSNSEEVNEKKKKSSKNSNKDSNKNDKTKKNKNKNKKKDENSDNDEDDEEIDENEKKIKIEKNKNEDADKFIIRNFKELELLFENPLFTERFVNSRNLYIILFVALARTAGYRCNFVASLHPIPLSFAKKKSNNDEGIELWTEIYCKNAKRWIPVNPLNKHSVYPIPKQLITSEFNEISYVITIDEDGFIKERTKRYAKDFLTYTRKLRLKNNAKWWEVNIIKRYFTTNVIDDSDEEVPDETEEKQPLPTSISGFLNHPLYVLERHIKKYEVLYSKEPVLGYIRNEAIYPRSNVRPVNTKEYWIRQGLSIKEGAKAAKYVKSRVYTIKKKRMIEFSKQNAVLDKDFNIGDEMVPLYGDWQTELYKSPPVKDGIVPKSQFGNIDMFKPSMLPEGGTHLKIQGLGPLARKLNIDFANAVIGFDFRLGHCVPIIDGIVVATENVELLLSKFEEFEMEKFRKFMEKREKRILSNWRRLVKGLLTRERLIEKYGKKKHNEDEDDEMEDENEIEEEDENEDEEK